ncbi:hypothetical protein Bca101_062491 [Brassica carinata]
MLSSERYPKACLPPRAFRNHKASNEFQFCIFKSSLFRSDITTDHLFPLE